MKFTGKSLTLRGELTVGALNNSYFTKTILDYSNVLDIEKGWRVRWIEIMPQPIKGVLGARIGINGILATDDIVSSGPTQKFTDNRQIGWTSDTYIYGDVGGSGVASLSQSIDGYTRIIDPDHIIQRRLDLSLSIGTAFAAEAETAVVNYIIYLEEVKITPVEAVISNIKSVAQDIDN